VTGASVVVAGLAGLVGWALMTVSYLPMLRSTGYRRSAHLRSRLSLCSTPR